MSGQWVTTLLAVLGAGLGLAGVGSFWATGDSQPIVLPWAIPGAEFSVGIDGLSAIFLAADFPDLAAGKRLRAGLLEADGASAERPEAAALLRHSHGRHGAARDRPQQHPVSVRLGDHGALDLLPGHHGGRGQRMLAKPAGSTSLRRIWRHSACSPSSPCCVAASGSFALAPLNQATLTPGMATAIFVLALAGFGFESRHHAVARLAAQCARRLRRAMCRRSCRASSSRWASTACSG